MSKKKDGYFVAKLIGTLTGTLFLVPLGFGIYGLFNEYEETVLYICFGITVVFFITAMICSGYLNKRCSSCHELLFGAAYEWSVIKQNVTGGNSPQNEPQYKMKYHILFTCPHCGTVKTEKQTFFSKHGFSDCEIQMLNYCAKKFGH